MSLVQDGRPYRFGVIQAAIADAKVREKELLVKTKKLAFRVGECRRAVSTSLLRSNLHSGATVTCVCVFHAVCGANRPARHPGVRVEEEARVLDTRVQTASKKLKERLRTLSYVFAVRLGSVSRVRGVSLVVAGSNSLSVSCSSYGIVSEWHVAGLGHARHR
jgi:hypothetical protein